MKIDAEEFEDWRQSPVSQFFFRAMNLYAESRKEAWIAQSWEAGKCDPLVLHELKGQAESAEFFADAPLEQLLALIEEPE